MTENRHTIQAIGIVVPARDEEAHIEHCLSTIAASLARLPPRVAHAVCVVLDRCVDRTAERAQRQLARQSADGIPMRIEILRNHEPATVGSLRHTGLRRTLQLLADHQRSATWLLSTDADTTVDHRWALDHLRYANQGADAVAGMADLDDPTALNPRRQRQYAQLLAAGIHGDRHTHIYAANLGIRADAYLAAGGFPSTPHGEDHQLHARLIAAGRHVVSATDVRVRTSSRRHGRAPGGLADLLNGLP
ncbi:MAG TPA: glycosyltransferase [Pseudonocardia sp.]